MTRLISHTCITPKLWITITSIANEFPEFTISGLILGSSKSRNLVRAATVLVIPKRFSAMASGNDIRKGHEFMIKYNAITIISI